MKDLFYNNLSLVLIFFGLMYNNNEVIKPTIEKPIIIETVKLKPKTTLPENFTIIYESFKTYNPYVDSSSALTVTKVSNYYGLSKDSLTLKLSIGQLLLESGAKQYYQPTHPKEGRLVESYAGAIGFSQILPTTAYGYLTKKMSQNDIELFKYLGATNFSFVNDKSLSKSKRVKMTRKWLENETNNIILWGKIMNSKLKQRNIYHALITYNAGTGGLIKFLNTGRTINSHAYIKGILSRLSYVGLTI